MILEYSGADWKEVQESCEGPPNYSKDEWLAKKFTLGLDFPNLPYLMDGKYTWRFSAYFDLREMRKKNLVFCGKCETAKFENITCLIRL